MRDPSARDRSPARPPRCAPATTDLPPSPESEPDFEQADKRPFDFHTISPSSPRLCAMFKAMFIFLLLVVHHPTSAAAHMRVLLSWFRDYRKSASFSESNTTSSKTESANHRRLSQTDMSTGDEERQIDTIPTSLAVFKSTEDISGSIKPPSKLLSPGSDSGYESWSYPSTPGVTTPSPTPKMTPEARTRIAIGAQRNDHEGRVVSHDSPSRKPATKKRKKPHQLCRSCYNDVVSSDDDVNFQPGHANFPDDAVSPTMTSPGCYQSVSSHLDAMPKRRKSDSVRGWVVTGLTPILTSATRLEDTRKNRPRRGEISALGTPPLKR